VTQVEVGRSIQCLLGRYKISPAQLWRRRRDLCLLNGEIDCWFSNEDVEALDCLHLFVSRREGLGKTTRRFQETVLDAPGEASIKEKLFSYLESMGVYPEHLAQFPAARLFQLDSYTKER
jgi:hypothetical protein